MPFSDRAFRALVREQPEVLTALIDVTVRPHLALDGPIRPEDVDDPHLDLPPTIDSDSVARSGDVVLHTECQGYRDSGFDERVFRYHLLLTLRYPKARVETIALWLTRPGRAQRSGRITRGKLTLEVHVVLLRELPVERLLAHPRTVCFAPCGDARSMSDEVLCNEVARRLRDAGAGGRELHMAVIAAAVRGRYDLMIRAMEAAKLEPVIIEDLVRIGEDRGIEKGIQRGVELGRAEGVELGRAEGVELGRAEGVELGRAEGVEEGRLQAAREMLLEAVSARGLAISRAQRERVERERSLDQLRRWLRAAMHAESLEAVLD